MVSGNSDCRVGLYARVSSEHQAQANTIASQVEAIAGRIAGDGLALADELRFIDDGYSGGTLVRPAMERLRDMAAAGAMDRLYVHSPDRLSRNYAYQVLLVDELEHCGVELVLLNNKMGDSPEEKLLLQVQGMIAEYERAKILERSRRGKLHAARRGSVSVLAAAPYGYRYRTAAETGDSSQYQVVLEEARIVVDMFGWVGRERCSINEVCRRLDARGVPTRTGRKPWSRSSVFTMLTNPAYKGMAAYGKRRNEPMRPRLRPRRGGSLAPRRAISCRPADPDQWIGIPVPALVDEELFGAVAQQLEENRRRCRQRPRGARYLLQGLLVCKRCGYAFCGTAPGIGKGKSYSYYRCSGRDGRRFGGQAVCDNSQVRADLLEQAVWADVSALLSDPERIQKEYQRRLTPRRDEVGYKSREQLDALTAKVKRGIARLLDAYADGLLERQEFEPRLRQARDRLAGIQEQARSQADEESQQSELRLVVGRLQEFAQKVRDGLQAADRTAQREILRALVKEVQVDQDEIQVVYRIGPNPFDRAPERGLSRHCPRRYVAPCRSLGRGDSRDSFPNKRFLKMFLRMDGGPTGRLSGVSDLRNRLSMQISNNRSFSDFSLDPNAASVILLS